MSKRGRSRTRPEAELALIVVTWAATWPASQLALRTWPPLLLTGVRCFACGVLLMAFALARGLRPLQAHLLPVAVVSGGLNVVGALVASTYAVHFLSGGVASLLLYLQPLFLVGLARAFFTEPLRTRDIAALVIGFGGVALITLGESSQHASITGVAIGVGGALSWALGVHYLRREERKQPGVIGLAAGPQFLIGGAFVCVLGEVMEHWPTHVGEEAWISIAVLTLASTVGWFFYLFLLERGVSAKRLSPWLWGVPVLANVVGIGALHQGVSALWGVGAAMVLISIAAIEFRGPSMSKSRVPERVE